MQSLIFKVRCWLDSAIARLPFSLSGKWNEITTLVVSVATMGLLMLLAMAAIRWFRGFKKRRSERLSSEASSKGSKGAQSIWGMSSTCKFNGVQRFEDMQDLETPKFSKEGMIKMKASLALNEAEEYLNSYVCAIKRNSIWTLKPICNQHLIKMLIMGGANQEELTKLQHLTFKTKGIESYDVSSFDTSEGVAITVIARIRFSTNMTIASSGRGISIENYSTPQNGIFSVTLNNVFEDIDGQSTECRICGMEILDGVCPSCNIEPTPGVLRGVFKVVDAFII